MARIAVGGFQHETNTFAPQRATWADFERADAWPGFIRGAELIDAVHGYNIPIAGAVAALKAKGHELLPLCWCSAPPSSYVERDAYERVAGAILTSPSLDPAGRTLLHTVGRWLRDVPREPMSMAPVIARDWLRTGPVWMLRGLAAMLADPIEELLPRVTAPTLVVRGERDAIVPSGWAQEAARLLPYGRLVEIPGAVHAVTFDAPEALAALVSAFLAEELQPASVVSRETA